MSKGKDGRARAWTFEVYPESAPSEWKQMLDDVHIPIIISPLHDKDVYERGEKKGQIKKAHWHCIISFEGKKSQEQIIDIIKCCNGPNPETVDNMRSMVRYLCHLDHPNKAQYSTDDIIRLSGFDVKDYLENPNDRYAYVHDMQQYVVDNNITEFWVFSMKCYEFHRKDWWPFLVDSVAFIMNMFIRSYRNNPSGVSDSIIEDAQLLSNPDIIDEVNIYEE